MCIYPALLLSLISVTQGSVHRVLRSSTILHNQGNDLPRAKEMDRRRPQSIPVIRQQTEVEPDSFLIRSAQQMDVRTVPQDAIYQCASEYDTPKYGCTECTMSRSCACDGFVRFGYDSTWSSWQNVSGTVSCDSSFFGDPWPSHGKVCMCIPRIYTCATEWSVPTANCSECVKQDQCTCYGHMRFGYGNDWSTWAPISGSRTCKASEFGDPNPGQGKICECRTALHLLDTVVGVGGVSCITNATIAVLLVYFATFATFSLLGEVLSEKIRQTLEITAASVRYAPMICVVLMTVSRRAEYLARGQTELYNLPPLYLKVLVAITTIAFLMQTLFRFIGEMAESTDVHTLGHRTLWTNLFHRYTILMFIAVTCVMLGTVLMDPPPEIVGELGTVHHITICTFILAATYFLVHFALHTISVGAAASILDYPTFWLEVFRLAALNLSCAPMLCVAFMGTRMALSWSDQYMTHFEHMWMYVCTLSLVFQVFLILITPALSSASLQARGPSADAEFVTSNRGVVVVVSVLRWLATALLYGGVFLVCKSAIGVLPHMTSPLLFLSAVFFIVYAVLWIFVTLHQLNDGGFSWAIQIVAAAKDAVIFCPMLGVLLLLCWFRALGLVTGSGPGEPQNFMQDYFLVALVCLLTSLSILVLRVVTSDAQKSDEGVSLLYILYVASMVAMYFSIGAVFWGLLTMTPGNATAAGSWFLE